MPRERPRKLVCAKYVWVHPQYCFQYALIRVLVRVFAEKTKRKRNKIYEKRNYFGFNVGSLSGNRPFDVTAKFLSRKTGQKSSLSRDSGTGRDRINASLYSLSLCPPFSVIVSATNYLQYREIRRENCSFSSTLIWKTKQSCCNISYNHAVGRAVSTLYICMCVPDIPKKKYCI